VALPLFFSFVPKSVVKIGVSLSFHASFQQWAQTVKLSGVRGLDDLCLSETLKEHVVAYFFQER
jgi:hypothetical protein